MPRAVATEQPDPVTENNCFVAKYLLALDDLARNLFPVNTIRRDPYIVIQEVQFSAKLNDLAMASWAEREVVTDLCPGHSVGRVPDVRKLFGFILAADDPDLVIEYERMIKISARKVAVRGNRLPVSKVGRFIDLGFK